MVPPRRVANGVDRNRLSLVLAVLARHGGPSLGSADVFVSVAGGVRIEEPGADLAVALALASAARGEPLARGGAPAGCFGEIGLTGELRYVAHPERRLQEAARFGLERVVLPVPAAWTTISRARQARGPRRRSPPLCAGARRRARRRPHSRAAEPPERPHGR